MGRPWLSLAYRTSPISNSSHMVLTLYPNQLGRIIIR